MRRVALRRPAPAGGAACSSSASGCSSRTIHEFVAVGADVVGLHAGDERSRAAFSEAIADELAASACASASTTSAAFGGRGLEEINRAGRAGFELRILML